MDPIFIGTHRRCRDVRRPDRIGAHDGGCFLHRYRARTAWLAGAVLGFDAGNSLTYSASGDEVQAMSALLSRYVDDVRGKSKKGFTDDERTEAAR